MPSVSCKLNIEFSPKPGENRGGWVCANSQSLRMACEELGYSAKPMSQGEYHLCEIDEEEGSDKLDAVRDVLIRAGLKEVKSTIIPKPNRRDSFAFRCIRKFSKRDLDQAEFLRLNVMGLSKIADFSQTTAEGYVLKANKRLKNNLVFGWLDIIIVPYVSEKGREQMERESFTGIHFKPAIFDEPEKAVKHLYELTSTQTMPPCLLPIKNDDGEIVAEDWKYGARIWDDGGYVLPILKYHREKVETMGAFDIAKTRELTGHNPRHYRYQYIVSQRFRQHLEAMKVRSVDFVPVELVDEEFKK